MIHNFLSKMFFFVCFVFEILKCSLLDHCTPLTWPDLTHHRHSNNIIIKCHDFLKLNINYKKSQNKVNTYTNIYLSEQWNYYFFVVIRRNPNCLTINVYQYSYSLQTKILACFVLVLETWNIYFLFSFFCYLNH